MFLGLFCLGYHIMTLLNRLYNVLSIEMSEKLECITIQHSVIQPNINISRLIIILRLVERSNQLVFNDCSCHKCRKMQLQHHHSFLWVLIAGLGFCFLQFLVIAYLLFFCVNGSDVTQSVLEHLLPYNFLMRSKR